MRLVAVAIVVFGLCVSATVAAELEVGVSAVDITPRLCPQGTDDVAADGPPFDAAGDCFRWVHLAGFSPYVPYATNRIAQGVHDPLWSRALAVRGVNGETVVLVATDLPGLGGKHINPVRRRVERTLGIPASHVVIHSTHTHSAPDASGYWSTMLPGRNTPYTTQLRERIYESIAAALDDMRPARMKTVTTTHVSCYNRRTRELKREPNCRLPDVNNQFDEPAADYDDFVIQRDQRDPIVRNTRIVAAAFVSPDDGQTIATLVNWHNHPDTLGSANRLISSDYPHYLREYLEWALGGVSVYFVGTLGNQIGGLRGTPVPLWDERYQRVYEEGVADVQGDPAAVFVRTGWDHIRSTGYEVGHAAVTALEAAPAAAGIPVSVRTRSLETPVDNMIHLLMTWSVWHHDVASEDRLRYRWPRCWGLLGCVRSDVSLLRIGELSILTAPGEIDPAYVLGRRASVADYGDRWGTWEFPAMTGVDERMPGRHHAVIGSAQDYLSYMIPPSDYVGWWNEGHPNHYEDLVTIGKRFGEDVARTWRQLLDTPLGAARAGPAPSPGP